MAVGFIVFGRLRAGRRLMTDHLDEAKQHLDTMRDDLAAIQRGVDTIRRYVRRAQIATMVAGIGAVVLLVVLACVQAAT